MLISEKQHQSNYKNAQQSTGPVTPEGKAAVRMNALKFGLRARQLLTTGEVPEDFERLWDDLEAEWQPRTPTERMHLEQMATSQWLLARMASAESRIYRLFFLSDQFEKQLALLNQVSVQRSRLERSFATALDEMKQLKRERLAQSRETSISIPVPSEPAAAYSPSALPRTLPFALPVYKMSEDPAGLPLHAAAVASDTR